MQIGNNNIKFDYFIDKDAKSDAYEEKDLRVWINESLKPSEHCSRAIKSANRILGIINKTYKNESKKIKARRTL